MGVKTWLKATILLPGLCLAALPVLARHQQDNPPKQQETDPVADAARRARDQQKAAPKAKKVYTDDDVRPAAPSNGGAAAGDVARGSQSAAGQKQGGAASAEDKGTKSGESVETKWRKRFADQRDKIATAEKELDILQRESDKSQTQYYSDPQKALMEQNSRKDINERDTKINAKKQEIASLKQQLADMEDQLRKSGGDPGWAR
jgi:type IV secretory pathway TrbL component